MARKSSRGLGNVPNENHEGSRSFRSFKKLTRRRIPDALFAHSIEDIEDPITRVRVNQTRAAIRKEQIISRNGKLALMIAATHSAGFLTPVWVIFGTDHLGLSLFASLVLGSASWVSSSIFEIPMGAFADKYGRQLSLIVGLGATAIGDFSLVLFNNYWVLMFFQVIGGIGFSMRSGSLEGLLHDTYAASGAHTVYSKLSSKMLFLSNGSRILTVPIGAWLYKLDIDASISSFTYPYIANATFLVFAMFCAIALVERRSSKHELETLSSATSTSLFVKLFGHVGETWREIRANRDILRIISIFGLYAVVGEGNWALYQIYFEDRGLSVGASGWIYSILVVCMTLGSHYVAWIYKRMNVMWVMTGIIGVVTFGVAWMHLPLYIAMIAFIANAFVGPMCLYLQDNAIQNRMEGDHKTTALSISNMAYNLGSMLGIFGIGAIAEQIGVGNAQWIFAIYGGVVFVVMFLWCAQDGIAIRPEDARAVGEADSAGLQDGADDDVNPDVPYDEASQLSPKSS